MSYTYELSRRIMVEQVSFQKVHEESGGSPMINDDGLVLLVLQMQLSQWMLGWMSRYRPA